MWRYATTRASILVLACGSTWARSDDAPPLLEPPGGVGLAPAAPAPIPGPPPVVSTPPPVPPRDDRGVLALPGINAPSSRSLRATPRVDVVLPPPSLAPSADGGLPSLELPSERRLNPDPATLRPLPSDRFRTRVIESSPSIESRPGSLRRPIADDLPPLDGLGDIETDDPVPPPPRRGGLFGRLLPRGGILPPASDSVIKAEPRTDPAADAAIKRRIERQARDTIGDRARSIDVRVVGRDITIKAHGTRLFQRRTVRHLLEGLPALSGYRSVVEVND